MVITNTTGNPTYKIDLKGRVRLVHGDHPGRIIDLKDGIRFSGRTT